MRSTRMLWGMLLAAGAAAACGEDAGPPLEPRPTRDLDFVLPAAREMPPLNAVEEIESSLPRPEASADTLPDGFAEIGGSTQFALITDTHAAGWWKGSLYLFEYSMVGWGTGFTMDPNLTLTSGTTGATLLSNGGVGRAGDYGIPLVIWEGGREFIDIGVECGVTANLAVGFEARLAITSFPFVRMQNSKNHSAYQAGCYTQTSGGGSSGGSSGYKICYYDVWVDGYGNVVDWVLVTCHSFGLKMT